MIKHSTVGDKTGFSLIVDEYTQLVNIHLITKKNKTVDHLKEFTLCMEAHGHIVQTIQTNSAAEFAKK